MSQLTAFIIEDDEDLSIIFAEALKAAGFEPLVINSGDVALDHLAQVVPHLVILDFHLPKVSGLEILRRIRSEERLAKVYVVAVSADASMVDAAQPHADLVLVKPIGFHLLRDLTARFLSIIPKENKPDANELESS